jgi:dTDP-4-dehydrorhamnose 3,5-epimerase
MTDFHAPELAAGVRWNDPAFAIRWPLEQGVVIAKRDAGYPDFARGEFESELSRRVAAEPARHG